MFFNPTLSQARRLACFIQEKGLTTFTFEDVKGFDGADRTEWVLANLRRLIQKGIVQKVNEQYRMVKFVESRKTRKGFSGPRKKPKQNFSFLLDSEVQSRISQLCQAYDIWHNTKSPAVTSFVPTVELAQLLGFSSVEDLTKFLEYCASKQMVFARVQGGYTFLGEFLVYFQKSQKYS